MDLEKIENRMLWKAAPFLRLILPLISGLLLEYYTPFSVHFLFPAFLLSFIVLIVCNCIPFQIKFRAHCIYGIAAQSIFIFLGCILMHLHQDKPLTEAEYNQNGNRNYLIIQMMTNPVQKRSSYKCLARIECLIKDQTCFYQNEKVLIYFNSKQFSPQVTGSSWIITDKILQPIENLKSLDFDYKKYCRQRHIYSQLYLRENEYSLFPHAETKSALTFLDSLRKRILAVIKQRIPSKSENSLLEALMVGFTDDLDPDLLKSYADTGVIHIIAISGLHLALICQFLQFVLLPKRKNKYIRWAKLIVLVTCLWSYSLLSGASPSVIRAAGMFSITLFARNIFRETTLYNILAASAFLLLCFDPFWIFDTGFQ
ncbi:MAG TPA: ComEC/Rec2 family competence protein, partial [Puia sp.]|nr:ComEC/Rec2 family competence protein [Puia sp.]